MLKQVAIGSAHILGRLGRALPGLLRDATGIAAVGAIAYGAWLIHQPAGFITAGTLVLAGVLLASRRE